MFKLFPHQQYSLEIFQQALRRLERNGPKPRYYDCGCCGSWHPADWNGDCRDDEHRYAYDEIDAKHGVYGWIAVDQAEVDQ